ncbi:MAG: S-methyl-5-thioribose-1-phosphate isomerase [Dehalococcoidia bacterium]|nr:S-methyl-5-thioribose-1-phosphate isomerase [Dehalococcoidia bacterium]
MKTIEWQEDKLIILDQTALPHQEFYLELSNYLEVVSAIKKLQVRGAPAIGVATAYGIALGAQNSDADTTKEFLNEIEEICQSFSAARPTAVNLFHAIKRMKLASQSDGNVSLIKSTLIREAIKIHNEEKEATAHLSHLGAKLIKNDFTILTHCNAGPLATTGYGTALGIIIAAGEEGKKIKVFADETRPLLQGARLTTWELMRKGITVTLITDSMAGHFLSRGKIDCVVVGADRIAQNGDTANKIGTYSLAVLAKENNVPFYVAAPVSTIDFSLKSGEDIPIEERNPEEVTHIGGMRIAPEGVRTANPAFDVTPHRYISAIITEKGIVREPYQTQMSKLCR